MKKVYDFIIKEAIELKKENSKLKPLDDHDKIVIVLFLICLSPTFILVTAHTIWNGELPRPHLYDGRNVFAVIHDGTPHLNPTPVYSSNDMKAYIKECGNENSYCYCIAWCKSVKTCEVEQCEKYIGKEINEFRHETKIFNK